MQEPMKSEVEKPPRADAAGTRLLVVGCGYLGKRVAMRHLETVGPVWALTRSQAHADEFARVGLKPVLADVMRPETLDQLPEVERVLYAVGFDRRAGHSIHQVYQQGLANVLLRLPDSIRRFVYISSTGVYGQSTGEWVDEESECQPIRAGGEACLAAEKFIADSTVAGRSNCLRLAGIYGPGRIPYLKELREGSPLPVGEGYLNLIHVVDGAEAALAALACQTAPRTWNVADGTPVLRPDYYRFVAAALRAPAPQFVSHSPATDSSRAERARSDKRISATRMRTELGIQLRFPSFREGILDSLGPIPFT
ncbi:MAG: NAD-dependent epimerase/dehydratase family protein [Planctomycetes bacterium]|nr:NAD-dependent epimerase/dehydratase family protein [Planctomycetota bacterium]